MRPRRPGWRASPARWQSSVDSTACASTSWHRARSPLTSMSAFSPRTFEPTFHSGAWGLLRRSPRSSVSLPDTTPRTSRARSGPWMADAPSYRRPTLRGSGNRRLCPPAAALMNNEDTGPAADSQPIIWDMFRALFVAGQTFVLLFVSVALIAAISQATAPPSSAPDTVMPALGYDDVALLGVGTAIALAGAVAS